MVEIIVATTMMITPTIIVQFKFIPFHKLQFKYWASSAQRINTSILADFKKQIDSTLTIISFIIM